MRLALTMFYFIFFLARTLSLSLSLSLSKSAQLVRVSMPQGRDHPSDRCKQAGRAQGCRNLCKVGGVRVLNRGWGDVHVGNGRLEPTGKGGEG